MHARNTLTYLTLLCCLLIGVGAFLYYLQSSEETLTQGQREVQTNAVLLAGELDAHMANHRRAAAAMSELSLIHLALGDQPVNQVEVSELLSLICKSQLASLCYVLDMKGNAVMANPEGQPLLGKNYSFRPYFTEAIEQGSAVYSAFGVTTFKRGFYFSHLIQSQGRSVGVAVIKVGLEQFDRRLDTLDQTAVLLDPDGVVFASNHGDWILRAFWPMEESLRQKKISSRQFGKADFEPLGFVKQVDPLWLQRDEPKQRFMVGFEWVSALPHWQVAYMLEKPLDRGGSSNLTVFSWLLLPVLLVSAMVLLIYKMGRKDLQRLHSTEVELKHSEERLRQLAEISNEAVVIHSAGQIIDANAVAERMFDYSQKELQKMEIWNLMTQDSVPLSLQHIHDGYDKPYEVKGIRANGEIFPMEVFAKASVLDGLKVRVACLRDITEYKRQEAIIRFQAHYDQLTGLPNRHLFLEKVARSIERAKRVNKNVVVMFIDLDDFKKINDNLGHQTGDQLLRLASERLQSVLRGGDLLARYGGDEYVLMLDEVDAETQSTRVAQRILEMLREPFVVEGKSLYLSGTIGISVCPEDGDSADQLLQRADTALYQSKKACERDTFSFYSPSMNRSVEQWLEIEEQLRIASYEEQFSLNYQPIVRVSDGKMLGAEVLVRWNNPVLGSVRPDQFIPLAEQSGVIVPLGRWIFETACAQLRRWLDAGYAPFRISVNVSPRQFRDPSFIEYVESTLKRLSIPSSLLVVEITEGLLVHHDEDTEARILRLKSLGIRLSMDDFGTGYSSLSYLKRFPFDVLKIDRSFVRDLESNKSDQQLVKATLAMAKGLDLLVVAEGVETEDQFNFLKEEGCYSAQGYLFSRPLNAEQFEKAQLMEGVETLNCPI